MVKRKQLTIPKLKKKLDTVFSKWVRYSETENGWGRCVTCGKRKKFEDLDCGHFISRNWTILRWDPRNCHTQCKYCNRFAGGEIDEYFLWIDKTYGDGTARKMISHKHDIFKLERSWLEEQIEIYKKKVEKLSTTSKA